MKKLLLGLLAACMGSPSVLYAKEPQRGIAADFPGDVGIEKHPAILFASGFEDDFSGWTLDARDRTISSIVDDPAIVHSGKKCCISVALKGKNEGGNVTWHFPKPLDQVYLRFYCRFDKDSINPHHFVKIRALREGWNGDAGLAPPGDKGFWTGIEPSRDGSWHFYTYWHQMRSGRANPTGAKGDYYGNIFTMPGQTPFQREKWICVEAMMKANTVGKSDGELAFWIEGKLIGWWKPGSPKGTWNRSRFQVPGNAPKPFEGFNFRTDPTLQINQIALQWYVSHEYAARGATDRNLVYFDDVVVAKEYIGPMNLGIKGKP